MRAAPQPASPVVVDAPAPPDPVALCRANIAAIRDVRTAARLDAQVDHWARGRRARPAIPAETERHRREAGEFARRHLEFAAGDPASVLVTVEGVDPPWMLLEVARAFAPRPDGFTARLLIVQADPMEFLNGLARADLRAVLGADRAAVFVGPDASARVLEWARDRFHAQLSGPVVRLRSLRTAAAPGIDAALAQARAEQLAEHDALKREVREVYRDLPPLAERARDRPLRVLVPTSRFTTFLRHAGADVVDAFRAAGLEADLLIEADDHTRHSSLAWLRRIREWRPDLIMMINWTRSMLGLPLPSGLPVVSWMQDTMLPQFRETAVASPDPEGGADWLVGNLHRELFTAFGHSRRRAIPMPVVASPRKFYAAPVAARAAARLSCQVAFVGHQSEAPDVLHARLVREAFESGGERAAAVLAGLRPRVEALALDPSGLLHDRLEALARGALRDAAGSEPDARAVARLVRSYALPLAERVIRHQTLQWAARIAERRAWRLHLYGRGWAEHPSLGGLARGELAHGEELRAAYACATVHLHASITAMVHQRVMECALSGGLALCRVACWEPVEPGAHEYDPAWLLGGEDLLFASAAELEARIERAILDPGWRASRSAEIAARVRERLTHDVLVRRVLGEVSMSKADRVRLAPQTTQVLMREGAAALRA